MMEFIIKMFGTKGALGLLWKLFVLIFRIIYTPAKLIFKASTFIGIVAYIVTSMLVFAFIIAFFQNVNDNSPWKGGMITFNSLQGKAPSDPCSQDSLIHMALIAAYAYSDTYLPELEALGYHETDARMREGDLVYVTLEKGQSIYIGFRGTDEEVDVRDDLLIAASDSAVERLTVARMIVEKIRAANPHKNIVIVGHSLGGSAVQYVVWWYHEVKRECPANFRAYTFNPYAFPYGSSVVRVSPAELLIDVVHEGDIAQVVRQKNRVVGQGILVQGMYDAGSGKWLPVDLHNTVSQHSIKGLIANMRAQKGGRYSPPPKYKPVYEGESFSNILNDSL